MTDDNADPKGLIREAYRIDGIGMAECRSIFLDWALSLPDGADPREALAALLERYAQDAENHPMTQVMRQGMERADPPRRRGGRSGRASGNS